MSKLLRNLTIKLIASSLRKAYIKLALITDPDSSDYMRLLKAGEHIKYSINELRDTQEYL